MAKRGKSSLALLAIAFVVAGYLLPRPNAPVLDARPSFAQAVAVAGFDPVANKRRFEFPRDHGPHRDQRIEWWYYTGNLVSDSGRSFGFQVTFFRVGLRRQNATEKVSAWRANDIYIAHAALTDIDKQRYHHEERLQRAALGLAGAQIDPNRVWLNNWSVESRDEGVFVIRVAAQAFALELDLRQVKPVVLQGAEGLSRKGPGVGEASYYYSIPRLRASGTVIEGGATHRVSGNAWLDREWTSAVLARGLEGWDWFGLQFESGEELMLYRMRGPDGSASEWSGGSWVERDGTSKSLSAADFALRPKGREQVGGRSYPLAWEIVVPSLQLRAEVAAPVKNQEFAGFVRYWEGTVTATGVRAQESLAGVGYMELTGY